MRPEAMAQVCALFGLEGRTAVVTGAGRGIGREIARMLALAGARVVLADLVEDWVRSAADEINADAGTEAALPAPTDVSSQDQVVELFARAVDWFGGVDVAVNVAGV